MDAASKFEYTASISEPTIFNLKIGGVNPLFRGPSEVYSFWVEPGKVISFEGKTGWLIKRLPWAQVSDLRGMNNSIAKSFLIRAVPDNFLLDPNGVIIARKLRGKQLEQKIDLIFKDK